MRFSLRPYQEIDVGRLRAEFRAGRKAPIYVLPTGGGKTVSFCHITAEAVAKGNRVWLLTHRNEILEQISRALTGFDVPHGVIAAEYDEQPNRPAQVASVQSLARRLGRYQVPDLIICDEVHHFTSPLFRRIIEMYPHTPRLGVTATPCRTDKKGLGTLFDSLVLGPSCADLIRDQWLCKPVYYAPAPGSLPDFSGIKKLAGDLNAGELEQFMLAKPAITGHAIEHYRKHIAPAPALVFVVTLKHGEEVVKQFNEAGLRAAMIEGGTDKVTRRAMIADLSEGRLDVMVSCSLISEGFDVPVCGGCILLRRTESLTLHLQQLGRALRIYPGKKRAVICDAVGNLFTHGFAETPRQWSLDGGATNPNGAGRIAVRQCPECFCCHSPAAQCPECGHQYKTEEKLPRQVDGELYEIGDEAWAAKEKATDIMVEWILAFGTRADPTMHVYEDAERRFDEGHGHHPDWNMKQLLAWGKRRQFKNAGYWAMQTIKRRRAASTPASPILKLAEATR